MHREPEPCDICGSPIVWAINSTGFELRLNPGRPTGGYPLTWGTVSQRNYMLEPYRKHALGPLPNGRLVHAGHNCKASAVRAFSGDAITLRGRWPLGVVLPHNHPWYGMTTLNDAPIGGDS